jgi:hypothetical protein
MRAKECVGTDDGGSSRTDIGKCMPGALGTARVYLHPDELCAQGSRITGRHREEEVSRTTRWIENAEGAV